MPAAWTACSSWRRATSARGLAMPRGRPTSASRRASRRAFSPAGPARAAGRRVVSLPLAPPLKPQLALSRKELPEGTGLPLRDQARRLSLPGVRRRRRRSSCSRATAGRSAATSPSSCCPPGRYVLDGEIVVRGADGHEDFDALGQRIHPAVSRDPAARGRDAGRVRGLRPARAGGRIAAGAALRRAPRGARASCSPRTASARRRSS